jgi:uncharacterized protein YecE (DUF72 family)
MRLAGAVTCGAQSWPGMSPTPRTRPTRRQVPRIGCAGWSIPGRHRSLFGEGDSMLARYATRFDMVEINTSFYRPHQRQTYARWASAVPRHFRFQVKLPREISHERALRGCGPALDRVLEETGGLGMRLGGFLLQLPPSLAFDPRSASAFFHAFRRRTDAPLACEPRHASWFSDRAEALLARVGVDRVAADPARIEGADRPGGAGHRPYWRWHGSPRIYYSDYPAAALHALREAVDASAPPPSRHRVVFDNTAHGHAIPNALAFRHLFEDRHHA